MRLPAHAPRSRRRGLLRGLDRRLVGNQEERSEPGTKKPAKKRPATTPATSRCWKDSNRSASGRACTSAPPAPGACTTSSTRWWTTPSTRPWRGYADTIVVTHPRRTGRSACCDNGRGIPVKPHPRREGPPPAVEVVLTVLHAGGKFGGGGYRISGGLHGVGVSRRQRAVERLEVEVQRDGVHVEPGLRARQAHGEARQGQGHRPRPAPRSRFWPDPEIFVETTGVPFETSPSASASSRSSTRAPRSRWSTSATSRRTRRLQGQRRPRRTS